MAPTVIADGFRFRTAASDINGATDLNHYGTNDEIPARNHFYFQAFAPLNIPYVGFRADTRNADGNSPYGSENIDAISNVYDQVVAGGRHGAPYSVTFRIQGAAAWNAADDTGDMTPFRFSGEFLNRAAGGGEPAGHNYGALRDINWCGRSTNTTCRRSHARVRITSSL